MIASRMMMAAKVRVQASATATTTSSDKWSGGTTHQCGVTPHTTTTIHVQLVLAAVRAGDREVRHGRGTATATRVEGGGGRCRWRDHCREERHGGPRNQGDHVEALTAIRDLVSVLLEVRFRHGVAAADMVVATSGVGRKARGGLQETGAPAAVPGLTGAAAIGKFGRRCGVVPRASRRARLKAAGGGGGGRGQ